MVARGEVWWASLPEPRGSEPGYERPVLVVQADAFNRSRLATIVVAAISTNIRLANAPGNVLLKRRDSGLPRDSIVNVSQLYTIDRTFLVRRVRTVRTERMIAVSDGLRAALDL